MNSITVLVISISNPILVGVYKNNSLIDRFQEDGKASDVIAKVFSKIDKKYTVDKICYVNGPGSYMAIKIAYITLKSLSIIKNIPLFAISGFCFNNNSPIKAIGKKYFININNKVEVDFIDESMKIEDFVLPTILDESIYLSENLPQYHLPAV